MGGFSIGSWLIVLIPVIVVQAVPIVRILRRAGISGWWTITYFVPLFGWISLWVFAFSPWPRMDNAASPSSISNPVGRA